MKKNNFIKELNAEELRKVNGGSLEVSILRVIINLFKKDFSPQA